MKYTINKYPDGTSYVDITDIKDPKILFKVNSYEDLWHLNQLVNAANNLGVEPLVKIPCLIDAQADRRFSMAQSAGLRLVCEFLKTMKATFSFFHPHNPEVVEAILSTQCTIVDNANYVDKIVANLYGTVTKAEKKLILMSSDAGGFKPLIKLCSAMGWAGETYSASKARNYIDGRSILTQVVDRMNFDDKDILIVDDICVYGGTFIGLSNILRSRNIGKLYLAVSHMTIQNHKNSDLFDAFDHVFTTNSKYDEYFIPQGDGGVQPDNLTIVKTW